MNDLVYVGYFSGVFGLKGEMKVVSDINFQDKIFKVGNKLIINNNEYVINKSSFRKDRYFVSLKDYEDINKIDNFLNKDIYIKRCDINLKNDEYLFCDLIGLKVLCDDKDYGSVSEVLFNKFTSFIKCNDLIIPINEKYIERVDILNKIIYAKSIGELIL